MGNPAVQASATSRRMSVPAFLWARRHPLRMISELGRWPGDLAQVAIGKQSFVVLKHPTLVQELLIGNAGRIAKGRTAERNRFFAFLGDGLLNSEGDVHTRQRRLVLPAFHRSRLSHYGEIMVRAAEASTAGWTDGEARDISADMMNVTLSVVGNTLFSSDVAGTAERIAQGFNSLVADLNRMIFPGASLALRLPLPFAQRIRRAQASLDAIVYELIRSRRASPADTGDLLSTLLMAEDAERPGERLSDLEIRNQVMTLFFAGQGTTANALSWAFWILAKHPEVQDAVREEAGRVAGDRAPTFGDVPNLTYTTQVLTEVLRMYPPVWTMGREALEDLTIGGNSVRKGTLVLAAQWLVHRDPRWFDDPEAFKPGRWTDEFRATLPRFAYFPFGGGARSCIGENFAWTEMILILATITSKWRLSMTPESSGIQPLPRISLGQDRPVRLRLDRVKRSPA
jgi:cytochrome P450